MLRAARRLLTRAIRGFYAVVHNLVGRAARRNRDRSRDRDDRHRAQLLLAPMESRDHTGNIVGGLALAALGYPLTDALTGMALAVGDSALRGAAPDASAAAPTVGDPPRPLTGWLPDDLNTLALVPNSPEEQGAPDPATRPQKAAWSVG